MAAPPLDAEPLKRSFPPVADARTRVLVLGSLPGEASLAAGRYYAHPRNQFWRLMEAATGQRLEALAYEARLEALQAAGVGLWDVVGSGRRRGSLDGAIRDPTANPLAGFVEGLPRLRAVAFNGAKAAALGRPLLGVRPDLALVALPSSSPALTQPFEAKRAAWRALQGFLAAAP